MESVAWPLTTRTWKALVFPLLPEAYFRLQGHEKQWRESLACWFRDKGLLAQGTPVHGLILTTHAGQCAGYLLLEMPEISPPHLIWNLLSLEITSEVVAVSKELQAFIMYGEGRIN